MVGFIVELFFTHISSFSFATCINQFNNVNKHYYKAKTSYAIASSTSENNNELNRLELHAKHVPITGVSTSQRFWQLFLSFVQLLSKLILGVLSTNAVVIDAMRWHGDYDTVFRVIITELLFYKPFLVKI